MSDKKALSTTYVAGEGREHLDACMAATFEHCRDHEVNVIVIYTGTGEGPCIAIERYSAQPEFANIRLVAVTPPANRPYLTDPRKPDAKVVQAGIVGERRKLLYDQNVPIVSARLPFQSVSASLHLGQGGQSTIDPMQLVDRAYGVLGGGFSFCLQAVLMACDAGAVASLERVAVMSADTAMVVIASQSESFLSARDGLLVEHVICRPLLYDISKRSHQVTIQAQAMRAARAERTALPAETDQPSQGAMEETES